MIGKQFNVISLIFFNFEIELEVKGPRNEGVVLLEKGVLCVDEVCV